MRGVNVLGVVLVLSFGLLVLLLNWIGELDVGLAAMAWIPIAIAALSVVYSDVTLGLFVSHFLKFATLLMLGVSSESVITGEPLIPPLAVVFSLLARHTKIRLPVDGIVRAQLVFCTLLVLGAFRPGNSAQAVREAWQFSYSNLMPFLCPLLFIGDDKRLRNILAGFWLGCVIWAIGGRLLGPDQITVRLGWQGLGAISLGRAAGIGSLFVICLLLTRADTWIKLALVPLGGWLLYIMLLTGTRGVLAAFLGSALAIVGAGLRRPPSRWIVLSAVLLVAMMVAVAVAHAPPEITQRLLEPDSYRTELYADVRIDRPTRLWIYEKAWNLFLASPIFGAGFDASRQIAIYPHNIFLEIAVELGVIGLAAFVVFVALALRRSWQMLFDSRGDGAQRRMMLLALAGLLFYLLQAQFSYDIVGNREIWFFAGLVCAIHASANPAGVG